MSPRAAGATQHELSRIGLLATLPGETLARLAQRMTREEIPAGAGVVAEGEKGDRFYVVLSGMLSVSARWTTRFGVTATTPGQSAARAACSADIRRKSNGVAE